MHARHVIEDLLDLVDLALLQVGHAVRAILVEVQLLLPQARVVRQLGGCTLNLGFQLIAVDLEISEPDNAVPEVRVVRN